MIANYITIFFRVLYRQKAFSIINVLGLAIGIAAALLIGLYVYDELSFDRFHEDKEKIYRLESNWDMRGEFSKSPFVGSHTGWELLNKTPGIESLTRLRQRKDVPVEVDLQQVNIPQLLQADSNFFSFFSFGLLHGNPEDALKGAGKIVLTEHQAQSIFNNEISLDKLPGKVLLLGPEKKALEVSGICKNPPTNSSIQFDALVSLDTYNFHTRHSELFGTTFFKLEDGKEIAQLNRQVDKTVKEIIEPDFLYLFKLSVEDAAKDGIYFNYYLNPLTNIHLFVNTIYELGPIGNIEYIYILSAIAGIVLLLACVNFINLSTAIASDRAREVSIRKTVGASRRKVVAQFMSESFLYVALAVVLALSLVSIVMVPFNLLSGKNFYVSDLFVLEIIGGVAFLIMILTLLSGSYPAFYASSFNPVQVLKGKLGLNAKGVGLRRSLVVFQFSISSALIMATIIVFQQLQFLQAQDPGYNHSRILTVPNASSISSSWEGFRDEVGSNPHFEELGRGNSVPSDYISGHGVMKKGSDHAYSINSITCDKGYMDALGLTIVDGRLFTDETQKDTASVVINEAAARMFGIKDLKQKEHLGFENIKYYEVIGIVKDFNFESFKTAINPLMFYYGGRNRILVRLSPDGSLADKTAALEGIWKKFSNAPFEYRFLSDQLQSQYEAEQKFRNLAFVFAALSVFISCIGLVGLVTYMAKTRTKEIGIRKVLGGSTLQMVSLISKSFVMLVLGSFVISGPVAWYFTDQWLQGFAYRIDFNLVVVALTGLIVLGMAIVSVSVQSYRAASANPAASLKTE